MHSANAELYKRAKQLIPGGTQLLSKRPEMYAPDTWPAYFREAKGCEIIDLDGRRYIDMSNNCVGACLLGYANSAVDQAVRNRISNGTTCSLNSPDEVELAELLVDLHPWSDMVRYARTGGEALAIAVRIARAATGRDKIAFCGYHGWSDWYLAANLRGESLSGHLLPGLDPAGVPSGLADTAFPFDYEDVESLKQIAHEHPLAAIVMEPLRNRIPAPGFLRKVRSIADDKGAVLIMDEVSAGWKFHLGGAHLRPFGVEPDVAVFAKSISNGYPMSAIIGRREIMEAAQRTFISSTNWTDGIGPAAAIATITEMQRIDLPSHLTTIGQTMIDAWNELGRKHGLPATATGLPQFVHLGFVHPDAISLETLFTIRMLDKGFLASSGFYPTLAHSISHVVDFTTAANDVFAELKIAIENNEIAERLPTTKRQTGFHRLT